MKIHYLATSNIPSKTANSLQITKMCEGFSANGEDTTLIVPNLICEKKTIKDYYDLNSSFKLIKIGKKKKLLNGLDNIFVPFNLVRHSLQINCDLIITRNLLISFILIFLKKKHIFEIHDDLRSSGNLLSKIFKYMSLLNSPSIKRVVFITKSLKKFIEKNYNYKNKNYLVLPDATDLIYKNKIKKKKSQIKKIGYFGSIYKSRGVDLIIKLAQKDIKNKYFIYGGSKDEFTKLNKFSSNNLIIHQQVSYKDVKKKIMEMDILLMPYTKKATFSGNYGNIINFMSPMKMFDYLGAGKIIISSNIKVLREILLNNYNSILINDYLRPLEWKKKIDNISLKSNFSIKLRKNALKTAKLYNWKNRARRIIG